MPVRLFVNQLICIELKPKNIGVIVARIRIKFQKQTVFQEIDMCPDWNMSSLADTLGISRQDMIDI